MTLLSIKEAFFPELLDIEERLDFEQAEFDLELADLRADCIEPLEATKITFIILYQFSKLIKLGKLTGASQAIKEQLEEFKECLFNLFKTQQENPAILRNISILNEERHQSTTELESERENFSTEDTLEITSTALDLVNTITPCTVITNIATTAKILSELKKPLVNTNINICQKIFKTAGHVGKLVAEFTPIPAVGKIFSNAVLLTGSLLGVQYNQNAA